MFSDQPRRHRRFRPQLERLEGRDLPSTVVHPGDSIQQAVDNAAPWTTIYIQAGTYDQSVNVDKAGIKLIGVPGHHGQQVIIENPGGVQDGISVTQNGAGFVLKNVVVRGFDADGVKLVGVDGFSISHVAAVNDKDYGIFPVFSAHGVIEYSTASGSGDTGIYVGQSSNVRVEHNSVHDNQNGIEIENSSNVKVGGNLVNQNTVGIFVDLLPPTIEGIQVTTSSNNRVIENIVVDNNRPNSATPPDITAFEPSGLGILLVGGDATVVSDNLVIGNCTGGIVLLSGLDLLALAGLPSDSYGTIDPNPNHTSIRNNIALGNGNHPADPSLPHADLIASPSALQGTDNHWKNNIFKTSFPGVLP